MPFDEFFCLYIFPRVYSLLTLHLEKMKINCSPVSNNQENSKGEQHFSMKINMFNKFFPGWRTQQKKNVSIWNLKLSGFCKYLRNFLKTSKKHKLKRLNPSPIRGTNTNFSKDFCKRCPQFSNRYLIPESYNLVGDFSGKAYKIPPLSI